VWGSEPRALSPRLGGLESNEMSNPGHFGLPMQLFPKLSPIFLPFGVG
jgi:hypothetical protein